LKKLCNLKIFNILALSEFDIDYMKEVLRGAHENHPLRWCGSAQVRLSSPQFAVKRLYLYGRFWL
jgi:hypothetical protein